MDEMTLLLKKLVPSSLKIIHGARVRSTRLKGHADHFLPLQTRTFAKMKRFFVTINSDETN